ncbi:GL19549 [Drosophila persimilis]|uniref:GL19549 n=1 Tax=Drosophila persimilis TaxID=7234 RepID=B4G6M1_DROPE|nr:GL19549 [Drosophila persimilis]
MNKSRSPYTGYQGKWGFPGTETDSETEELCNRPPPRRSRLESLVDLAESSMSPATRRRLVASYQRCSETLIVKALLLVGHLLWHTLAWLLGLIVGVIDVIASRRHRRCSIMPRRQMKWPVINVLEHQTVVFFAVGLAAPCLLWFCLMGFLVGVVALLKQAVR